MASYRKHKNEGWLILLRIRYAVRCGAFNVGVPPTGHADLRCALDRRTAFIRQGVSSFSDSCYTQAAGG